jgi:hypothetical protein
VSEKVGGGMAPPIQREPLRLWAPVAAILAAALQMAAYTGYKLFYQSFGVTPEETGIEYSSILVRSALQLLLLFVVVLLLLTTLSLMVSFYPALGWLFYRWNRSREAGNLARIFPSRASRYGALGIVWFAGFLGGFIVLARLSSGSKVDGGITVFVLFVWPLLLAVLGEHLYLRLRSRPEPSLMDLCVSDVMVGGIRRITLFFGALLLGSAMPSASILDMMEVALAVFVLDAIASRIMDASVGKSAHLTRVRDILRSRWLRDAFIFALLMLVTFIGVGSFDRLIRLSKIDSMVTEVANGGQLTYQPNQLNPFLLAQPKAISVEVLWISSAQPPDGFEPQGADRSTVPSRRLTYFGQAQGAAVFYDKDSPNGTPVVRRLPVGSIEIRHALG